MKMTMTSFKSNLKATGQSVLDSRAQMVFEMAKMEEDSFIAQCRAKVLTIVNQISQLKDLSVKTTDDLNPTGGTFDAKVWIAKRHDLERKLRIAKIEYALAIKVNEEEFPNDDKIEEIDLSGLTEISNISVK